MVTLKLKIKDIQQPEFIRNLQQDYSYAFRKLFRNYFDPNYKEISKQVEKQFHLNSWFMDSLQVEVKTKIEQIKTNKKQVEENIVKIHKLLDEFSKKTSLTKKERRKVYRLKKKEQQSSKSLGSNITFGGKTNLKNITKLHNKIKKLNSSDINYQETLNQIVIATQKYKEQRILPISSIGESPYHGNRFFQIIDNTHILFKPSKSIKIIIELESYKNKKNILTRLKEAMQDKYMAVSFKLSTEYIWISYDEQKLNGFAFDKNNWSKELKKYPKNDSNVEIRKQITKDFYQEQKDRQSINKLPNRYIAIDLNPQFIGYSICDYKDKTQTIIDKGCIDLSKLNAKLNLSSTNQKQKHQNNKREFEICQAWKYLFKLATHYKCAYFVMEDLNFKPTLINENSKEGNRQTKNLWHRTLTTNLIKKYTNQLGIQLIEVNPCYSSFIGNINYKFYDPVNASLEINRRGCFKYVKEHFFPNFSLETALDTMSTINQFNVRDALNVEELNSLTSYIALFNLCKKTKLKYRRCLNNFKQFSLNNINIHFFRNFIN